MGPGDLDALGSWFFRRAQFGMGSLEKSKHLNLAFKALYPPPSPTHSALRPWLTAGSPQGLADATPCCRCFLYPGGLIPSSTFSELFHILQSPPEKPPPPETLRQLPPVCNEVVAVPDSHSMAATLCGSALRSHARERWALGG